MLRVLDDCGVFLDVIDSPDFLPKELSKKKSNVWGISISLMQPYYCLKEDGECLRHVHKDCDHNRGDEYP